MKPEGKRSRISTQVFKINCIKSACEIYCTILRNRNATVIGPHGFQEIMAIAKNLFTATMKSDWIEAWRKQDDKQ